VEHETTVAEQTASSAVSVAEHVVIEDDHLIVEDDEIVSGTYRVTYETTAAES
jgi:hypothetical protein